MQIARPSAPAAPNGMAHGQLRQPLLLLTLTAMALALGAVTYSVVSGFHARVLRTANAWFAAAQSHMAAQQSAQAVSDLRIALRYKSDDLRFRPLLAQALLASGQDTQAQAYFLTLLEAEPGDGFTNLELGRLAAKQGSVADAMRYYNGAIYGAWDTDAEQNRRQARLELVTFLLRQNRTAEARAQLIALAADLPPDPSVRATVAADFARAGDYARAAQVYRELLKSKNAPDVNVALADAEFHQGNYEAARQALERAARSSKLDEAHASELALAVEAAKLDLTPHMPAAESRRRAIAIFDAAGERLRACGAAPGAPQLPAMPTVTPTPYLLAQYAQWDQLKPKVTNTGLREDPDLIDEIADLALAIESTAQRECGAGSTRDQALVAVLQKRQNAE